MEVRNRTFKFQYLIKIEKVFTMAPAPLPLQSVLRSRAFLEGTGDGKIPYKRLPEAGLFLRVTEPIKNIKTAPNSQVLSEGAGENVPAPQHCLQFSIFTLKYYWKLLRISPVMWPWYILKLDSWSLSTGFFLIGATNF